MDIIIAIIMAIIITIAIGIAITLTILALAPLVSITRTSLGSTTLRCRWRRSRFRVIQGHRGSRGRCDEKRGISSAD